MQTFLFTMVVLIVFLAYAYQYLSNIVKRYITKSILSTLNKSAEFEFKFSASRILKSQSESLRLAANKEYKIGKLNSYKHSYVLGSPLVEEYLHSPEKILNLYKSKYEVDNNSIFFREPVFVPVRQSLNFSFILSLKFMGFVFLEEHRIFSKSIADYVSIYGVKLGRDILEINDLEHFSAYFMAQNALVRTFGKAYKNSKKLQIALANYQCSDIYSNTQFAFINFFIKYWRNSKIMKNIKAIEDYVEKEAKRRISNKNPKHRYLDVIQALMEKEDFSIESGTRHFTPILLVSFKALSIINPSRIANILVDISVRQNVSERLYVEQARIVTKYGNLINLHVLDQMEYLDAVIYESIRLSSPLSFIPRIVSKDVFLSNGLMMPKGSHVSLNAFYHNRNPKKFGPDANLFNPERVMFSKRKLHDISEGLSIWGTKSNPCPARRYASNQLKLVISIILRKYFIFSKVYGSQSLHPGYQNIREVVPRQQRMLIKRHNILLFQPKTS